MTKVAIGSVLDNIDSILNINSDDSSLAEQQAQTELLTAIDKKTHENVLQLTYDNIANVPVVSATSVVNWNTYFSTNVIETAEVSGNTVILKGVGNFNVSTGAFASDTHILSIVDSGFIKKVETESIKECSALHTIVLYGVKETAASCLYSLNDLVNVTMPELEYMGDSCFTVLPLITTLVFPNLKYAGAGSFYQLPALLLFSAPELIACDDSVLNEINAPAGTQITHIHLPKLTVAGKSLLNQAKNLGTVNLNSVKELNSAFNYATFYAGYGHIKLDSLTYVKTCFQNITSQPVSNIYVTNLVNINTEFNAFKALNPNIVIHIIDSEITSQTSTSPTLTVQGNTGTWLDVKGCSNFELVLALGTATTPPVLKLQADYSTDGSMIADVGVTLTGSASKAVSMSVNNINPARVRYYVETAGVTLGAGVKVQINAR
jgi:hypothetical protein